MFYKWNQTKFLNLESGYWIQILGLQLSPNVIFMFVLQNLLNIDICVAKSTNLENGNHLGS